MGAIIAAVILSLTAASAKPLPLCAADASTQALKLLKFYVDNDDRATIDPDSIRKIGTVASLAGKRRFDVLELYGNVYKGHYRLRLIYAHLQDTCVLMGEEIFEVSDL